MNIENVPLSQFASLTLPEMSVAGFVFIIHFTLAGFLLETVRRSGASKLVRIGLAVIFGLWLFGLLSSISASNMDRNPDVMIPFVTIVSAVLVLLTAFGRVLALKQIIQNTPQELLQLSQGLRVFLGAGWLIQSILGFVPNILGLTIGLGEITAAFLALKTALPLARGCNHAFELWFTNIFGLLNLTIAIYGVCFLLPRGTAMAHPNMQYMLFAVPLYCGLHLASIGKFTGKKRTSSLPAVIVPIGNLS